MAPYCATCTKVIQPADQLVALDKFYHKPCFKCSTCGKVLTLNDYSGYSGRPYCKQHAVSARPSYNTETNPNPPRGPGYVNYNPNAAAGATNPDRSNMGARLDDLAYGKNSGRGPGSGVNYSPHSSSGGNSGQGPKQMGNYRALYDYTAADADEVSFIEYDEIAGYPLGDGYLMGTVKTTGSEGRVPMSYLEPM